MLGVTSPTFMSCNELEIIDVCFVLYLVYTVNSVENRRVFIRAHTTSMAEEAYTKFVLF